MRTVPPVIRPWRITLSGMAMLATAGALLVLFLFNPTEHRFYPVCLFHQWTGWHCPGCGALRALHSLTHGRFLAALHFNPLLVLALPFLAYTGVHFFLREVASWPLRPIYVPNRWIKVLVAAFVLFTVLRNIPVAPFTWLAPPASPSTIVGADVRL